MQGGVDAIEKAVRARKLLNQAPRSVEYVAPSTQTHELLAEIWMDVLNLPRVGIHENFFDLGGHSLMVTQVVSRVRKAAQVELGFQVLFKNQTIAELADYIDSVQLAQKLQPSNEDMASGFETGEL